MTGIHRFEILEEFSRGAMLSNAAAFERTTLGDLWLMIHVWLILCLDFWSAETVKSEGSVGSVLFW